jgi:hypothetical protein
MVKLSFFSALMLLPELDDNGKQFYIARVAGEYNKATAVFNFSNLSELF